MSVNKVLLYCLLLTTQFIVLATASTQSTRPLKQVTIDTENRISISTNNNKSVHQTKKIKENANIEESKKSFGKGLLFPFKPFKPNKPPTSNHQGFSISSSLLSLINKLTTSSKPREPPMNPSTQVFTSSVSNTLPKPGELHNQVVTTEKVFQNITQIQNRTENIINDAKPVTETINLDQNIIIEEEINNLSNKPCYETTENVDEFNGYHFASNETSENQIENITETNNYIHNIVETPIPIAETTTQPTSINDSEISKEVYVVTEISNTPSESSDKTVENIEDSKEKYPLESNNPHETVHNDSYDITYDVLIDENNETSNTEYQCKAGNSFHMIPGVCDTYIECRKHKAFTHVCPDGLFFNAAIAWPDYPCTYASEVQCDGAIKQTQISTTECKHLYGIFASTNNCSQYVICKDGVASTMSCPPGLAFNSGTSSCDWPDKVPDCTPSALLGFTCPTGGNNLKYRYQNSCRTYVMCQQGYSHLLRCDFGLSFDDTLQMCIDSENVRNCDKT